MEVDKSMRGSIINKIITLLTGSVLTIIVGLMTTPIITRIVNPEEYGRVSWFNMYANIAMLVIIVGLDQGFVRFFHEYNEEGRKSLFYWCNIIPITIFILVFGIMTIAGGVGIQILGKDNYLVFIILGINVIFLIMNRFSLLVIRMQQKAKTYAILNVLQKVIYILVFIMIISIDKYDKYIGLILAITLSNIIITVISMVIEKEFWAWHKVNKNIDQIDIKELLTYSYPYIFTFIITWLFQFADRMTIKIFGSFEDVGIYTGAINIIAIFTIIQTTFNTLWAPIAFEHYNKQPDDRAFYTKANQIMTIIMFAFGVTAILFKDILAMFLGQSFRTAAYIMPCLIFNPIMYTLSETTVLGINFKKKTKWYMWIGLGSALFNIIGNVLLVPRYGPRGAALSTGLAYILFFALRTNISNHYYKVDYKLGKLYFITAITLLYAVMNSFEINTFYNIAAYLLVIIALVILYRDIILFLLKLVVDRINLFKSRSSSK